MDELLDNLVMNLLEEIHSVLSHSDGFQTTVSGCLSKSIRVNSCNDDTDIYIRVERMKSGFNLCFSSIYLEENNRRRGILTRLCDKLSTVDGVKRITVSGICTPEMWIWCNSRGYTKVNQFDETSRYKEVGG